MEQIVRAMMDLIASEVCGWEPGWTQLRFSDEELVGLYKLSKFHDLAHLVGDALIKHDLIPEGELRSKFEKQMMVAVYRYERINYELAQIKSTLNAAEIPFLPLKGSVLRQFYPEPWMRTSCDIDVLVKEEDLDRAVQVLVEKLGCRAESRHTHDYGLYTASGVHLELHFLLVESSAADNRDPVLETVWERCKPSDAEQVWCYAMPESLFYYYHIAHMAKHFQHGGCGIRPFLDIWVLDHREAVDHAGREALLKEGGLEIFSAACERLSQVWFAHAEADEITEQMEAFLLTGGVYGTLEKKVTVQQAQKGGKFRYAMSRIWLPYDQLVLRYPSLTDRKILLPFYEVCRWCKLLFGGSARKSAHELKVNFATNQKERDGTKKLLDALQLK